MHHQGFDLSEIQNVTKHKNIESLKHYLSALTYKEKKNYNCALLDYAENNNIENQIEPAAKKPKKDNIKITTTSKNKENYDTQEPSTSSLASVMPIAENISPENCLVPMFPDEMQKEVMPSTPQNSVVQNNQLKTASHMFQSATFNNCNFTFELPK